MLLKAKGELFGRHLIASDGAIGSIRDVYFDDERWIVRYLEVDTSDWLGGRKVLISPVSVKREGTNDREVAVALSRDQVRNSPDADQDMPVSRQFEEAHARYYGYPFYWDGPSLWGSTPPARSIRELKEAEERAHQSHLRSCGEVIGYRVAASDGGAGHVEDLVVDDTDWAIRNVVVDTRDALSGKHVLVPAGAVVEIVWLTREVRLKTTREAVENAPQA